ncbi:hypothetical protein ACNTMW_16645 [Planosporangium sp. 12N6]|uniref:hypothetical protein n=1 Tax=Planosporangium spinosum TaxID=3402278 RepID=UPI003CEC089A
MIAHSAEGYAYGGQRAASGRAATTTCGSPLTGEPGEARVMAGPERIEWRRAFPFRAVAALAWYAAFAGVVLGAVWLFFGDEPAVLDDGTTNPLASVPTVVLVVVSAGGVPLLLAVVRRPLVAADHYALTVRPGVVRTLVLPWARITCVAARRTGREAYLLVQCRRALGALGDRPAWWDQGVLRAVHRTSPATRVPEFDLAVCLRDFIGEPRAQLAALASVAPAHVLITCEVDN